MTYAEMGALATATAGETIVVPFANGPNGVQSAQSYSGPITLTVSGIGNLAGCQYSDAFYLYADCDGTPYTPPQHYTGRDNFALQINQDQVDALVQPVPSYRSDHLYTVPITAPGGPLTFGAGDDGTYDNVGQYVVTITVPTARGAPAPTAVSGTIPWHPHHDVRLSQTLHASVDLADGHLDLQAADMSIAARGPNLTLNHTWDSALAQAGITTTAGQGWLDSLTPSIGGTLTGTLTYTNSSGAAWPLQYNGPLTATSPYTAYTPPPGQPWLITATASLTGTTGYTLTDFLTGATRTFDGQGRLTADADSYGNQNAVPYGTAGVSGATLPVSLTNSGGRSFSIVYTPGGLVDEVQSYNWMKSGAGGQSQHVTYAYSGTQLIGQTWGAATTDAVTATYGYSGTQLVTVTTPGGHAWTIGYDALGRVGSITSPASGTITTQAGYTPAYTTAFTYAPGQTQVVAGFGSSAPLTTTYALDVQGEPIAITDALGDNSTADYDADHDVITSTDADGHTTTATYQYVGPPGPSGLGAVGLVTEINRPAIDSSGPVTTSYAYDPHTYDLVQTVSANGSGGGNGITLFAYDGHHSVITTTQQLGLTGCGAGTAPPLGATRTMARRQLSVTSMSGSCQPGLTWRASVNRYDSYGELVATIDGRGLDVAPTSPGSLPSPTLNDQASASTHSYSYSGQGDLAKAWTPPITTVSGGVTSTAPVTTVYGYNNDGLFKQVTTPNAGTTYYNYDHLGRLGNASQPAIALWNSASGAVYTPTETLNYDKDGNLSRSTDGAGDVTIDSYDPLGRLVATTNPLGGTTLYTYTATTLAQVRDPAGHVTTYGYDVADRPITLTDPTGVSTHYGYDPVGNTVAITTPLDYTHPNTATVETRGYDALNEVISATVGGTGEISPTTPQTTLHSYDHDGNMTQVQAPNGDVTTRWYDYADRLSQANIFPDASSAPLSPPPAASAGDTFDAADNLIDTYDFSQDDHQASFDGANRPTQWLDTCAACPSALPITTIPSYDPDGNVLALTRQEGAVQTTASNGAYNADDWLTRQDDGQGTTSNGYDAAGRLRTQSLLGGTASGVVTASVNAAGWITTSTDTVTDTAPSTTTTSSSQFTYSPDGLPSAVTLNKGTGQLKETRQYDGDNRVTCLTAAGPPQSQVQTPLSDGFTYSYSAQGTITGLTASTTTAACSGSGYQPAQVMSYDALGRLTATNGGQWGYDGNANLATQVLTPSGTITTSYNYSNADGSTPAGWLPNELVSTTYGVPTGQLQQAFSYDASGNTTVITTAAYGTTPQSTKTLTYNAQGRLSSVSTSDGISVAIGYNARGLRASLVVSDTTPTFGPPVSFTELLRYRGDRVGQVAVLEGTSSFTETFLYRPDGAPLELLYQQPGQATARYFYVVDGQGNVVALTNSLGSVVDQYSYDLWGALTSVDVTKGIAEGLPQPLRYHGYWYDGWYDGAGDWVRGIYASDDQRPLPWYWLGVRAYDPQLKRFLEPDPSAQDGVRSYIYCHDDPVNCADPSGLAGGPIETPLPEPGVPVQLPLPGLEGDSSGVAPAGIPAPTGTDELIAPGESGLTPNYSTRSFSLRLSRGWRETLRSLVNENDQIVYQLTDVESGTVLKVGQTEGTTISGRFASYAKAGRRFERTLEIEAWAVEPPDDVTLKNIEDAFRKVVIGAVGANLQVDTMPE